MTYEDALLLEVEDRQIDAECEVTHDRLAVHQSNEAARAQAGLPLELDRYRDTGKVMD